MSKAKDQLQPKQKEFVAFKVNDKGVYYLPPPKNDEPSSPIWLCSRLDIVARVRDDQNNGHGLLLEWKDKDNIKHRYIMSQADLAGDGAIIRKNLLDGGLRISTKRAVREHFSNYLMNYPVDKVARSVSRTGWYKDAFVLSDEVIGETPEERVLLQAEANDLAGFEQAGTLEQWRNNVGIHCKGNHRLVFAVSCAFAALMLNLLNIGGLGFHFRGNSSSGKSTLLEVAKSVIGDSSDIRSWRATANALESVASIHNDILLCLDEIGEADEKTIGGTAYMLANGAGKLRSDRSGNLRPPAKWKTLFLSSGEISLADVIRDGGKKVKAGQLVRVIDIPADADKELGVFDILPAFAKDGAGFSDYLRDNAKKYHGKAFREYLRLFTANREPLLKLIRELQKDWLKQHLVDNADGQVKRVAKAFATVAASGALASEMGITGWGDATAAIKAAKVCFEGWIKTRGGMGSQEENQVLKQIKYFLEQHGEARFTPWNVDAKHAGTIYRAGFRHDNGDYYVLPETFNKHFCDGFDRDFVIEVLKKHSFLVCAKNGSPTVTPKIPANGSAGSPKTTRCYHIQSKILE